MGNGRKRGSCNLSVHCKRSEWIQKTFWILVYAWPIQVSETVLCVGGVSIIEPLGKPEGLPWLLHTKNCCWIVIELWVKLNKINFKMWIWIVVHSSDNFLRSFLRTLDSCSLQGYIHNNQQDSLWCKNSYYNTEG